MLSPSFRECEYKVRSVFPTSTVCKLKNEAVYHQEPHTWFLFDINAQLEWYAAAALVEQSDDSAM